MGNNNSIAKYSGFDYASLDPETRKILKEDEGELTKYSKQNMESAIKAGEILLKMKSYLPHGQFESWAKSNNLASFSIETGRRWMRIVKMFNVYRVDQSKINLSLSVLYLLIEDKTSDLVIKEILERNYQGENFTKEKVKKIILKQTSSAKSSLTKTGTAKTTLKLIEEKSKQTLEISKKLDDAKQQLFLLEYSKFLEPYEEFIEQPAIDIEGIPVSEKPVTVTGLPPASPQNNTLVDSERSQPLPIPDDSIKRPEAIETSANEVKNVPSQFSKEVSTQASHCRFVATSIVKTPNDDEGSVLKFMGEGDDNIVLVKLINGNKKTFKNKDLTLVTIPFPLPL